MIEMFLEPKTRVVELPEFYAASAEDADLVFGNGMVWRLDQCDLQALIDTLIYCLEQSKQAGERACSGS